MRRNGRQWLGAVTVLAALTAGCSAVPEGTVNGETISQTELNSALRLTGGTMVLQRLFLEHAVLEEARRNGVTLDETELKSFRAQIARFEDPTLRRAAEQELRAHLLLRKLILKSYTTDQLRKLYDLFKEPLTGYWLNVVATANAVDAKSVAEGFAAGFTSESLSNKYGVNAALKKRGGSLGFLTRGQIEATFGPLAAESIVNTDEHHVAPVLHAGNRFVVVQVGRIRSSFTELKPHLEDIIVEGVAPTYIAELMRSSKIDSRYEKDPNLMPQVDIFARPMYDAFREEAPPEVAPETYRLPGPEVGGKIGTIFGVAVPGTSAGKASTSVVGVSVGEEMGIKVPGFEKALRGGEDVVPSATPSAPPSSVGADVGEEMGIKIPGIEGAAHTE